MYGGRGKHGKGKGGRYAGAGGKGSHEGHRGGHRGGGRGATGQELRASRHFGQRAGQRAGQQLPAADRAELLRADGRGGSNVAPDGMVHHVRTLSDGRKFKVIAAGSRGPNAGVAVTTWELTGSYTGVVLLPIGILCGRLKSLCSGIWFKAHMYLQVLPPGG